VDCEELPLQVGDMVTYNNYVAAFGVSGKVVGRLGEELVRGQWSDLSAPVTHHTYSLKRAKPAWR